MQICCMVYPDGRMNLSACSLFFFLFFPTGPKQMDPPDIWTAFCTRLLSVKRVLSSPLSPQRLLRRFQTLISAKRLETVLIVIGTIWIKIWNESRLKDILWAVTWLQEGSFSLCITLFINTEIYERLLFSALLFFFFFPVIIITGPSSKTLKLCLHSYWSIKTCTRLFCVA